jgi:hypothetical protein
MWPSLEGGLDVGQRLVLLVEGGGVPFGLGVGSMRGAQREAIAKLRVRVGTLCWPTTHEGW